MSQQSNRRFILVVLLVVILAIIAIFFFRGQNGPKVGKAQTISYAGLPALGNPQAPNKILAVEDLKCHGCMVYNNLIYPKLKKAFIDTGKASYHVLLVSFLPGSTPAGNTALCLYQQKPAYFFNFVHTVYANQPPETENWATPAKLMQLARKAAPTADFTALSNCMLTNRYSKQLQSNIATGAKLMDNELTTPTLFINGQRLQVQPSVNSIKPLLK
jgi:protein-disulfide isomerase